ncbi:hypothetical protein GC175_00490 [bacterium]|nr:hypothetical protein [bacterium]
MSQDSYLLRFWRLPQSDGWRVTLIGVLPDAPQYHFNTVEELLAFLTSAYLPAMETMMETLPWEETHPSLSNHQP